jgi:hypothetical protein
MVNIKMDFMEIGEGVYKIHLAQDRDRRGAVVNTLTDVRVPQKLDFLASWATVSFSTRAQLFEVITNT